MYTLLYNFRLQVRKFTRSPSSLYLGFFSDLFLSIFKSLKHLNIMFFLVNPYSMRLTTFGVYISFNICECGVLRFFSSHHLSFIYPCFLFLLSSTVTLFFFLFQLVLQLTNISHYLTVHNCNGYSPYFLYM